MKTDTTNILSLVTIKRAAQIKETDTIVIREAIRSGKLVGATDAVTLYVTEESLADFLPHHVKVSKAARLLNISVNAVYAAARRGDLDFSIVKNMMLIDTRTMGLYKPHDYPKGVYTRAAKQYANT